MLSPTERRVQARRGDSLYVPQISIDARVIYGSSDVLLQGRCRVARGKKTTLRVEIVGIWETSNIVDPLTCDRASYIVCSPDIHHGA
jgi:hypothetical protein